MNKLYNSAKRYVQCHKEAVVVGVTLGTVIIFQNRGIKSLNAFLTERGLFEEYYLPIAEELI